MNRRFFLLMSLVVLVVLAIGVAGNTVAQDEITLEFWHAMGGKDHRAVGGRIVQLFDKHRALGLKPVDDKLVMHNFVAHIDRGTPFAQGHLDDLDGAVHTGAEPSWCGEV